MGSGFRVQGWRSSGAGMLKKGGVAAIQPLLLLLGFWASQHTLGVPGNAEPTGIPLPPPCNPFPALPKEPALCQKFSVKNLPNGRFPK